jgi:hypothetical protein
MWGEAVVEEGARSFAFDPGLFASQKKHKKNASRKARNQRLLGSLPLMGQF